LNNLKKKIAKFLGRKLPYFIGKNIIIRTLYNPNRNINSGEKFTIDYFGKKYAGITSNYIDWGVYFYEGLEKGLINYIKSQISQFNYFFDIGSNSGTISLPFIGYKNLKIICFEPLAYSYNKLVNNFKLNNAIHNTKFFKLALSDTKGEKKIFYARSNSNIGMATLAIDRENNFFNEFEKIKTDKLDNLFKLKNKKIFIKIDVENYETKVIEGAKNFLNENKILMYLETENKSLLEKLKKKNFRIYFPKFKEGKFKFISKQYSHHVILKNF
jgi:FkbM family methyltransferase